MTARQRRTRLTEDAREAFVTLFEDIFFKLMTGMLRSQDIEERYVALRDRIREATEQQIATLARTAAEYYVSHANPGPISSMSRDEVDRLKRAALEHALNSVT